MKDFNIDYFRIISLYKKGYSCKKISKLYSVCTSSIRNLLRKNKISLRNRSDCQKKHNVSKNYFERINNEEKAYFLGLLYADGCIYGKYNNMCELALSGDDELLLLNKFRDCIKYSGSIFLKKKIKVTNKQCYKITICDHIFCKNLINKGCIPRKSLILKFPSELQVPFFLIRHFVRGYFDGDGCLRSDFLKNKNSQIDIQIISSHSFCNSLQEVVNKQINENGHISIQKCAPNSSYYRIGGNIKGLKFLKWIYDGSTIYLNRKYNLYKKFLDYYLLKIKDSGIVKQGKIEEILSLDYSKF